MHMSCLALPCREDGKVGMCERKNGPEWMQELLNEDSSLESLWRRACENPDEASQASLSQILLIAVGSITPLTHSHLGLLLVVRWQTSSHQNKRHTLMF